MTIGVLILLAISFLIFIGKAKRILGEMEVSEMFVLITIAIIIVSIFVIPDIPIGNTNTISIGGTIVPIYFGVYIFLKIRTLSNRMNTIFAGLFAGLLVFFIKQLFISPNGFYFTDNNILYLLYGIIGGFTAYVLGRSFKSILVISILGTVVNDVISLVINNFIYSGESINLGTGVFFDSLVISTIFSLTLSSILQKTKINLIKE